MTKFPTTLLIFVFQDQILSLGEKIELSFVPEPFLWFFRGLLKNNKYLG